MHTSSTSISYLKINIINRVVEIIYIPELLS